MFIHIAYKDPPELSLFRKSIQGNNEDVDESVDKSLLVNPVCPVRVMLEFIRKRCKLGKFSIFDLCDDTGALKGFFLLPSWAEATDYLVHRKVYYIIILQTEGDKQIILPQLNREQPFYRVLLERVNKFVSSGEVPSVQHGLTKASAVPSPGAKTKARKKRISDT